MRSLGGQEAFPEAGGRDQINGLLQRVIAQGRFEPARVFEHVYYVGAKWASAWAITTPEGIILIDGELAAREGIDVFLSNHAGLDGSKDKLAALASRSQGDSHPYVIGVENVRRMNVRRMMTVLAECGSAALAGFDAAAVPK